MLARISTEFVLRRVNRARTSVFDGDLVMTLVFATITQANIAHIDDDAALGALWGTLEAPPPDDLRRPVSGYAVALALGLPRETIRRKINALLELGMAQAVDAGFVVPTQTHADESMIRASLADVADSQTFFSAMMRAGILDPGVVAQARTGPVLPRMISRVSNTYCLAVLEELRRLFSGELMAGLIFCAIANANGRRGPGEPARDWDEPPTERPRPITALAVAETVGLPRETARRHIKKLEQLGFCDGGRRGLIIPESVLSRPGVQAAFERSINTATRFVGHLAQAGVLAAEPGRTAGPN